MNLVEHLHMLCTADTAYDAGEQVGRAFTPACQMGIRSLPNALHPDFRQQLWEQLMDQSKSCS
jgi:hypothetical protein